MIYTATHLQRRYQDVDYALASQRLEGLEPNSHTIEDLKAEARGEMTMDDVRTRLFKRFEKGEL